MELQRAGPVEEVKGGLCGWRGGKESGDKSGERWVGWGGGLGPGALVRMESRVVRNLRRVLSL